jgi:hypothetical protein
LNCLIPYKSKIAAIMSLKRQRATAVRHRMESVIAHPLVSGREDKISLYGVKRFKKKKITNNPRVEERKRALVMRRWHPQNTGDLAVRLTTDMTHPAGKTLWQCIGRMLL